MMFDMLWKLVTGDSQLAWWWQKAVWTGTYFVAVCRNCEAALLRNPWAKLSPFYGLVAWIEGLTAPPETQLNRRYKVPRHKQ